MIWGWLPRLRLFAAVAAVADRMTPNMTPNRKIDII
jgi:hypothetical protein